MFEFDDIKVFVKCYDLQLFYFDEEVGKVLYFGGFVVSGWYMCLVFMSLLIQKFGLDLISMGLFGIDLICWLKLVCVGDMIMMYQKVYDKCVLESKFDCGIVLMEWVGVNEVGEMVIIVYIKVIFGLCYLGGVKI